MIPNARERDSFARNRVIAAEKSQNLRPQREYRAAQARSKMNSIMSDCTVTAARLTPFSPPAQVAAYDLGAWLYDWIVGSRLYHQWVWGMAPSEHTAFARRALDRAAEGAILDAGCGSLLFGAPCYRDTDRPLTLLDASTGMLTRARRRLGTRPAEWVQADLRALPFESAHFANVFHFGVLHCIEDAALVLGELARVTHPGGKLFVSSLTLGRARGDAFLRRLARSGHVAEPRRPEQILSAAEQAGFTVSAHHQHGSFLFIEAERRS
jgi:SAM-dependent methyltransferase